MPRGGTFEANKSQSCMSKNGIFKGLLDLGTENGDGWELSSQTECKILFSMHIIICSCSS